MKLVYAVTFWLLLFNVFIYPKPYDTYSLRSSYSSSLSLSHAAVIKTKNIGTQFRNQQLVSYASPLPRSTQPVQLTQKKSQNSAPIKPVNQPTVPTSVNISDQRIVNQLHDLHNFYNQKNGACGNAILTQRISALKTTLANPIIYNRSYQLSSGASLLLSAHGYDKNMHEQCTGTEFQQVMQCQLNYIVEQLADYNEKVPRFYTTLHNASVDFVHAGTIANNNGYIEKTVSLADFCFATLDLFKAVSEGIVAGTTNSGTFIYRCVTSPISMIKEIAEGIGHLSLLFLDILGQYDEELINLYALSSNNPSTSTLLLNNLVGKLIDTKPYDVARTIIKNGTALAVEGVITELVLVGIGKFARNATVHGTEVLKNLAAKAPGTGEYAVALAEATEVKITEHAAEQFFAMIEKEKQVSSTIKSPQDYSRFWKNPTIPTRQEIIQTLSHSQELKELEACVKELNKIVPDTRYGKILANDSPLPKIDRIFEEAKNIYEQVMINNNDIQSIIKNTGINEKILIQIKSHVFFEEHILIDGIRTFYPEENMAFAWRRLIEGNYVQSDLRLLLHEYAESLIMQGVKVSYNDAHYTINDLYKWEQLL